MAVQMDDCLKSGKVRSAPHGSSLHDGLHRRAGAALLGCLNPNPFFLQMGDDCERLLCCVLGLQLFFAYVR